MSWMRVQVLYMRWRVFTAGETNRMDRATPRTRRLGLAHSRSRSGFASPAPHTPPLRFRRTGLLAWYDLFEEVAVHPSIVRHFRMEGAGEETILLHEHGLSTMLR